MKRIEDITEVRVVSNDIEGAIRALQKRIAAAGVLKSLKSRSGFISPSSKRRKKRAMALYRQKKTKRR